ncbi:MAG TPA: metallophosphoesterase [Ignavibacteriaceae bacterium]|nr:metallophosphoesterase [Ignavibacteriaceae bacterium]
MFKKWIWLLVIFGLFEFSSNDLSGKRLALISYSKIPEYDISNPPPLAVIGDLQRTSLFEIILGREQNDEERTKLANALSKEGTAVNILLGDMVFEGDNYSDWKYFDTLVKPIIRNRSALIPVMGNHEYFGNVRNGFKFISERFPQLSGSTWSTMVYDSLGLIFLDSNFPQLMGDGWNKQIKWYKETLAKMDTSSEIKGILVFTHHPPFTNSKVTTDEIMVQKAFLQDFLNSPKTISFFSGHAHTYERFKEKGKMFIVSGGGGGPRVMLNKGKGCHDDLCSLPAPRPFHYLLLDRIGDELDIKVKGLPKSTNQVKLIDEFTLSLK